MEQSLSYQARRALLQQTVPQYREASPSQKRTLVDAFVAATGYHRTYARWLLNHAEEVQQTLRRPRPAQYGPEVQHALFLAWHAANRICAKRLIPFLPTLLEALERHEHLQISEECRKQLLSMSAATADRLLSSQRKQSQRGLSTTRAGTLLKQQIPIRTFEQWDETQPGFLEVDLVAHCGTALERLCVGPGEDGKFIGRVMWLKQPGNLRAMLQPGQRYCRAWCPDNAPGFLLPDSTFSFPCLENQVVTIWMAL